MPDIDVSDLLFDSDIAGEAFSVIRRQEVVGGNGVATLTVTTLPLAGDPAIVGSVTPTGDNSLVRAEAYSTQSNTIKVITEFRLRGPSKDAAGQSFQPDIVLWNGNHFVVSTLNEWTSYGAGFVEAECTSFDFNTLAPT
jgi:galactose-6-phosphate isomerase